MGKCECDDEDGNGNAERERERVEMHTTELFLWQQRGEVASLRMRRAAAAAEFNFYKRVDVMQREVSPTDRETALNSGAALYPLGYKNIKKEKRSRRVLLDVDIDIASRLCL